MNKYSKYFITIFIGVAISMMIMLAKNVFVVKDTKEVLQILVDSFFVSGILIFGFGLLVVSSNGGTFDMVVFGVQKAIGAFKKDLSKEKYKTFYDYRKAKLENQHSYLYLIIIGGVFILISLIILVFYYKFK